SASAKADTIKMIGCPDAPAYFRQDLRNRVVKARRDNASTPVLPEILHDRADHGSRIDDRRLCTLDIKRICFFDTLEHRAFQLDRGLSFECRVIANAG